jgi:arylsulfatase A-like enzyme
MSGSNRHLDSINSGLNRRDFIKGSAVAAAFPATGSQAATLGENAQQSPAGRRKPNIVVYISDQFRWDMVSVYGLNPMQLTPNLDAMARRGTLFRSHITNQPVCAPSRAGLFTGQYQNKHGVWRNGFGLAPGAVTLATELRKAGYTANYVGKWHLAPREAGKEANTDRGRVTPQERGGFLDFWEGSNELEWT